MLEVKVVRAEVLEQVRQHKFTELAGEARRLLDHDWLAANGLRVAMVVGGEGDEYVVYRPQGVANRLRGMETQPFPDLNGPAVDLSGARMTPEMMTAARIALQNAPLRQDSVISRILNADREAAEHLTRTPGHDWQRSYQWSDGDTQFVLDDTMPPSEVALERTLPTSAILDEARQITEQTAAMLEEQLADRPADLHDDARVYFAPALLVQPDRPDHYRVRGGECGCGFRSNWTQDMDRHIADEIVPGSGGVPKRWKVCECGESRLCREVAVADHQPISWSNESFDPTRTPTFRHIYLCDDCCRRKGIS